MKTQTTNLTSTTSRRALFFSILLVIALIKPVAAFSQSPGNPVCIAVKHQINPAMTRDGSGGTIITWQDKRSGKYEIYAQRMNSYGNAVWTTNGVAICTADSNYNPMIVSDGSGGAIISWQAYRGSVTSDIFAQRVNSSGAVQWDLNGVPVCTVVFEQDTIAMISDGLGGAILTWQDYRSNNGFPDIYAQRVNSSGAMLWTANGVSICNQAAAQRGPKLVSDGSGGAFITWYDNRAGNYDIYTQRIGSGGAVQWTTNGVATCTMATDQLKPDICSDGAAGVIITWYDYRSTTDFNIYAQRQGPAGAIVWAVDGVVMNNNVAYDQIDPKIVSDEMGGAIISWTDYRTGTTADIYAQRVNSTGTVQWTATGVIICTSAGDQIKSQLVSDGNNGAYITWEDHRNTGNSDIYAQRIASNAAINWAATGFAICTIGFDQLVPMIVSNDSGGAIVAWQDYRSGTNFDIYEVGFNTTGVFTPTTINITVIPQGFYNLSTLKLNMRDTVTAYLRNSTAPFVKVDSAKAVIDSVTFTGAFFFNIASSGTYYIEVKHRNSIETWSRSGGEPFTGGTIMSYDFTNSAAKAFGNNMKQVQTLPTRFAIYSGDVNQDGTVDLSDLILINNDLNNFISGYVVTDVNGDNFVNLTDIVIAYNNSVNFVIKITP